LQPPGQTPAPLNSSSNLKGNEGLDPQGFAPFGVVDAKGMNVVEMMYDQYANTPRDFQT